MLCRLPAGDLSDAKERVRFIVRTNWTANAYISGHGFASAANRRALHRPPTATLLTTAWHGLFAVGHGHAGVRQQLLGSPRWSRTPWHRQFDLSSRISRLARTSLRRSTRFRAIIFPSWRPRRQRTGARCWPHRRLAARTQQHRPVRVGGAFRDFHTHRCWTAGQSAVRPQQRSPEGC